MCDFIDSTEIVPAICTDHASISLVVSEIGDIKGPGVWK